MLHSVQWRQSKICDGDSSSQDVSQRSPHPEKHQDIRAGGRDDSRFLFEKDHEGVQLLLAYPKLEQKPSDHRIVQGVDLSAAIAMQT